MKLLFLSNYYPPFHDGGYEELCAEVRKCLLARGHSVAVMTSRRGASKDLSEDGIFRVLHNEINYHGKFPNAASIFSHPLKQRENETQILKFLTRFHPNAAVVWGMWNLSRAIPYLLEAQPGINVVYYIADYWPRLPSAIYQHWDIRGGGCLKKKLRRLVGQIILACRPGIKEQIELKFKNVYCVSQAVRQSLVSDNSIPKWAQVLYNGINLEIFKKCKRRSLPWDGNLRFVYSGRLSPDKGVHIILEALVKLKTEQLCFQLTLIGGGEEAYLQKLHTQVEQYGLNGQVNFIGRVPREKIVEILSDHDVLIAPSIWEEPMPRSIQEAMAMGLAVIGTQVGGIPEIVQDGITGLTLPPADAGALADRMRLLIQHPELIQKYAQSGRQLVEQKFDIRLMVYQLEQAIVELA